MSGFPIRYTPPEFPPEKRGPGRPYRGVGPNFPEWKVKERKIKLDSILRDAQETAFRYQIDNIGRHPMHCATRDLLIGSLLRDGRAKWYKLLLLHRPDWLSEKVAHLPVASQAQALQLVALNVIHHQSVNNLISQGTTGIVDYALPDIRDFDCGKLLDRVSNCRPFGARFKDPSGAVPEFPACGHAKICPWCYGRVIHRLYRDLSQGLLKATDSNTYIGMMRVSVPGSDFGDPLPISQHELFSKAAEKPTINSFIDGEFSPYQIIPPGQMKRVRNEFRCWLVQHVCRLGAQGGLFIHQVSSNTSEIGFYHSFTVLFSIRAKASELDRVLKGMRTVGRLNDEVVITPPWILVPASHPMALRFSVMGSSVTYPVHELCPIIGDGGPSEKTFLRFGFAGAFSLNPTYLMRRLQWWSLALQSRHQRMYSSFGTWRACLSSSRAHAKRCEQRSRAKLDRSGAMSVGHLEFIRRNRRLNALKRINALRQTDAQKKITVLLGLIKEICQNSNATNQKSGPGWTKVQQMLRGSGHQVSEWIARQLAKRLRDTNY